MEIKNNKLALIVLMPVLGGIALIVAGIVNGRGSLLTAGIVVAFGGSFLVAIITTIVTIVRATRSNTYSTAKNNQDDVDDVLSEARRRVAEKTGERSSETDEVMRKIEARARKRKRTERFTKVLGVLFVVSFILFLFGGMGLMVAGYMVAGGIVFACGPAMILISLIIIKIKEHVLIGTKASRNNYRRKVGRVTQCMISRATPSKLYRVEVEVDGKSFMTYTEQAYSKDEKVEVTVYRNGKFGSIIGPTEYSFVRSERTVADKAIGTHAVQSKDNEEEKQKKVVLDSVFQLRDALEIDDKDEQRQARTEARHALFAELNKLKAIRAELDSTRKENSENAETIEQKEPTITTTPSMPTEKSNEQSVQSEPIDEKYKTMTLDKKPTIGYKGINRKK